MEGRYSTFIKKYLEYEKMTINKLEIRDILCSKLHLSISTAPLYTWLDIYLTDYQSVLLILEKAPRLIQNGSIIVLRNWFYGITRCKSSYDAFQAWSLNNQEIECIELPNISFQDKLYIIRFPSY